VLTACALLALYLALTLLTPRVLASRRLLIDRPATLLRLWFTALTVASVSLLLALGIFIARALVHHGTHIPNHDIAGPLIDSLLGWLSIAVIGLIAFRLGVAAHEARALYRQIGDLLAPVISSAETTTVGELSAWVVDSPQPLVAALPQARRVVITSRILNDLTPPQLAAVVAHEESHLRHHHERVLALGSLVEAVAPAFLASNRMAQSCRIATELIADDDASRACGTATLASALEVAYPDAPGVSDRIARLHNR